MKIFVVGVFNTDLLKLKCDPNKSVFCIERYTYEKKVSAKTPTYFKNKKKTLSDVLLTDKPNSFPNFVSNIKQI